MIEDYYQWFEEYLNNDNYQKIEPFLENGSDSKRLLVFKNTYFSACTDLLKRKYPSCLHVLGKEYFQMLAFTYSKQNLPSRVVMSEFGEMMPEFIENYLQLNNPEYLYVFDLAKLDRAWHGTYFAGEEASLPNLSVEFLENIEQTKFQFTETVRLFELDWAVSSIWSELKNGAIKKHIKVENERERILMWRDESHVYHRLVDIAEWTFIKNIKRGNTLLESAELAFEHGQIDISDAFSQLLSNNLLKEI